MRRLIAAHRYSHHAGSTLTITQVQMNMHQSNEAQSPQMQIASDTATMLTFLARLFQ